MHEFGVLKNAVKIVTEVAEKNHVSRIKFITLEIGEESSFEPIFFEKLYPAAIDSLPLFEDSQLKLVKAPGKSLIIKEIGY